MQLKLIACEILYREICATISRSINRVDVEFLPKGLHDIGQAGMFARLRDTLAAVDQSQYDAILFGYGLCSNGVVGLAAGTIPLVLPRAHDCITLFLGDKDRYLEYFQAHPGAYFKTSGWIERGDELAQLADMSDSIQSQTGMNMAYQQLVEKYGKDNAEFLREQLSEMTHNYSNLTYIEMGIEPDDRFERLTRDEAARRDWTFDMLQGDMGLLQTLVDGPWDDERFLVVQPGHEIAASFDDKIVKMRKSEEPH